MIKETSKMKTAKKLVVLMVVLAMVFALSTTAFAATGTVTVVFEMPDSYVDVNGVTQSIAPLEFTTTQNYSHDTTNHKYIYTLSNVNLSSVGVASGQYAPDTPTLFDVIYYAAVTIRQENNTGFVYGYDSSPWTGNPGYYITMLSGLSTIEIDSDYDPNTGSGYWKGYSWALYCVNGTGAPTSSDMVNVYASNIAAANGQTIYMVFQYSNQVW